MKLREMNALTSLGIDTSGKTASVCIYSDGIVKGQTTIYTELTHSQVILPLCKKLLADCELSLKDIDIFAVADGPGSYTGLRIGISAVKAMCFALEKLCVGISTLESLANNLRGYKGIICSIMKARQDLVYTAIFSSDGNSIKRECDDIIISRSELAEMLSAYRDVIVTGDGSEDFCEEFSAENIQLAPPHLRYQLASSLCLVAEEKEAYAPTLLEARYLQVTKAEKDYIK